MLWPFVQNGQRCKMIAENFEYVALFNRYLGGNFNAQKLVKKLWLKCTFHGFLENTVRTRVDYFL